jgi:DNA modification methylase
MADLIPAQSSLLDCIMEIALTSFLFPRIAAKSVQLLLTDLPTSTTKNDWDVALDLGSLWDELGRLLTPTGSVVVFAAFPYNVVLGGSNLPWLRHELVWVKPNGTGFLNAKYGPIRSHESVLVFCKHTPVYHPQKAVTGMPYRTSRGPSNTSNYGGSRKSSLTVSNGERYPTTVLSFARDRDNPHPTSKPLALMEYLVRTYSNPGDVVCDPCAGSGTTAIAAASCQRQFVGFERDRAIFETAVRRIRDHDNIMKKNQA